MTNSRPTTGNIALIALGGILLSFSPIFSKLSTVPPTIEGFYRMLFGCLSLGIIALIKNSSFRMPLKFWLFPIAGGFFFALDLFFWQRSIEFVGPGLATILSNCQVFFLVAIGIMAHQERLSWMTKFSLPLVFLGLFLLVGHEWGSLHPHYHLGIYYGLLTAIFYSGYTIVMRLSQSPGNPSLKPLPNLIVVCISAGIFLGLLGLIQHNDFLIHGTRNLFCMLAYGIICQAIAWLLISKSIAHVPLSLTGFILLLQPVLAFTWDILWFHRPTPTIEIFGAVLTLTAICLATMKPSSPPQANR